MTEFPPGFFDRADEAPDSEFYSFDRLVTHIDAGAIAEVAALYRELAVTGDVLDLCSSWISHFDPSPSRLVAVGMNANELAANTAADETLVHDLNLDPNLPFENASFDAVTCCVSVDYLIRPVEVFEQVGRVLRAGGTFAVTFSNRCFPTKAIRGWLGADGARRCSIVAVYLAASRSFGRPTVQLRNPGAAGDPLYAVWARRLPAGIRIRPATVDDQTLISDLQYDALFVPPGGDPPPRSVLGEPEVRRYHAEFATCDGDVGRIALGPDGEPVGGVWARRVEGGYGFVDAETPELGIAVDPGWRGRGIGEALLDSLLTAVPRCSLSVDLRNPARHLYERAGFELVRVDNEHTAVMVSAEPAGQADRGPR